MRLVIQRVERAAVNIAKEGKTAGKIKEGLFVLVGIEGKDTKEKAEILAEKLTKLRIMADSKGKMNLSIKDVDGAILAVSQFTLFADTSKGNRPSFIRAAEPKLAEEIYNHFVLKLKESGVRVETGRFGAYMQIETVLDGPVTIIL